MTEWTFESKSSDQIYTVKRDEDGNLWCTCRGWKFSRGGREQKTCRHCQTVRQSTLTPTPNLQHHVATKIPTTPTPNMEKIKPMLAEKGTVNQYGEWYIEPKYDGTRAFLIQRDGEIRILHRSMKDRTARYPELAGIKTYSQDIILDGEIVVMDQNGVPEFNKIQRRQVDNPTAMLQSKLPITYYVFDILELAGEDLRHQPLRERRLLLEQQLRQNAQPQTRTTPQVQTQTPDQIQRVFKTVTDKGFEGVMLKKPNDRYEGRRSKGWLKVKNLETSDLWITGYTTGTGSRTRYFGALLLADTPHGERVSKVGTGFNTQSLETITRILNQHTQGTERINGELVHLVNPTLKAEIEYLASPDGKKNRFPSFKRLIPQ